MTTRKGDGSAARLQVLAEFRHQLRIFLHFSEQAATKLGLQPQQHQLLLQVAGAPDGVTPTIGYTAERLGVRHNSVVELSKRCADAGLITRGHDDPDRRCVVLELTAKGQDMLEALSIDHARELNELAPQLIRTLSILQAEDGGTKRRSSGGER